MPRPRTVPRYEYLRDRLKGASSSQADKAEKVSSRLNELGAEGWELVGVEDGWAYLKRPKAAAAASPRASKANPAG